MTQNGRRGTFITAAVLLLPACASSGYGPEPLASGELPIRQWDCEAAVEGPDDGVYARLDQNGRQLNVSADLRDKFGRFEVSIKLFSKGEQTPRSEQVYFSVAWNDSDDRRNGSFVTQLTADIADRKAGFTDRSLWRNGRNWEPVVRERWPDILAYAREAGAPISLVLRGTNGAIVHRYDFPRDYFDRLDTRLQSSFADLRTRAADYARSCDGLTDEDLMPIIIG